MECPACDRSLQTVTVEDLSVDVCAGCGGLWFDNYELEKVDEQHESAGTALLEVEHDPAVTVDHTVERDCPKCGEQVMMRHFVSVKREVEVDECPACGGIWLDAGELRGIRTQYASDEERRKAAHDYFHDVFGDDLARMQAEREERLHRARRIARMFRFICPSYYLPGDQPWGAF